MPKNNLLITFSVFLDCWEFVEIQIEGFLLGKKE